MSGDDLAGEAALRLFGDLATPALLDAAEAGCWPAAAWRAVEKNGFADALAASEGLSGLPDAVAILHAAGRTALPLPLAETMLARWLLGGGAAPPATPLAVVSDPSVAARREGGGWRLDGVAAAVPWARHAGHLAILAEAGLFLVPRERLTIVEGANLAGEPRDDVEIALADAGAPLASAGDPNLLRSLAALCRAALIAGALERALQMAVRYANDRVQFGRPIAKFQAIQQQLAVMAGEVAAASVAVTGAAASIAAGGDPLAAAAIAKIRAGEAAGRAAEIAHQVHGAIGFTHEHGLHRLTRRLWSWRDEHGTEAEWALALGRRVAAAGAGALWPMVSA